MNKILEKLFRKNQQNVSAEQPQQKPRYDFVEIYTLANPQKTMVQYELFSSCSTIPVAIETKGNNSGFCDTIQLPTEDFLDHLKALKNAPVYIAENRLMRKVYIVHLENNEKMYVFPDVNDKQNIWMAYKKPLALNTNPRINRAITDILKVFSRQYE